MKIGIIGAGNVGRALGSAWARKGHEVVFGVRDPGSPKAADLVSASDVASAAAGAEVVVLATPWPATEGVVRGLGDVAGKVVLDCTNPLKPDLSGLEVGLTNSGAELVTSWAAGSRVVKIFNTIGHEHMDGPDFGGPTTTMLMAGDDPRAKAIAAELARDLGFDPVDAGPLANARLLEPLALLWIDLAVKRGHGTGIAFQLVRK